ncbi:MAG: carbohydrate-binding domain-containing protein [Clostridium sp.]
MSKKIKLIICGVAIAAIVGISAYAISASKGNEKYIAETSTIIAENIDDDWEEDFSKVSNEASITLNGDSIDLNGSGAKVDGSKITINSAGIYTITGKLNDGQIIVNVGDNDKVKLILNGIDINCSNSAPIYVLNADKTVIDLKDGSNNTITDGKDYVFEDSSSEEPNSAIYSKDDLTISGEGSLIVNGNYNNGITSKDDLKITGGNITVAAVNHGIKGKDSVRIKEGNIKITADGDGIKTDNTKETEKGYVYIASGTIDITTKQDGIQADTTVFIKDGDIKISSGGGSENAVSKSNKEGFAGKGGMMRPDRESSTAPNMNNSQNAGEPPAKPDGSDFQNMGEPPTRPDGSDSQNMGEPPTRPNMDENFENGGPTGTPNNQNTSNGENTTSTDTETTSTKGIKAGTNITIENGTLNIDSADDSLHTNDSLIINGGTFNLSSGDDGIHSDSTLDINGGEINITKSYEGIESSTITINDGEIHVVSSDDGLNAAGGNDGSSINGRLGQNNFNSSSNAMININGGYVYIDASGDGVDSNGSIKMTDGTVIVNGPTDSGNGALDYDSEFNMSGGLFVAAGSLGMVQTPSNSSSQYSMSIGFSSVQEAKTLVNISKEDGNSILTFAPSKQYQSLVVCSPNLKKGTTYTISTGGNSTGEEKDGLYSDGTYSRGTKYDSAEISNLVTNVGTQGGVSGGGMKPGNGKRNMQKEEGTQNNETEQNNLKDQSEDNTSNTRW